MNPWENISLSDYENHMSMDGIRQLQALNEIMREQLSPRGAKTAMILGIAGGNGLEHIAETDFERVYGVDVNKAYLDECSRRYPHLKNTLHTIRADLTDDGIRLPKAELLIANLLIEYIGYERFVRICKQVEPKRVSCVIQVNLNDLFVSESPYSHSFDCLNDVYCQIGEHRLTENMQKIGYSRAELSETSLPNEKKLVKTEFVREDGRDLL